MTIFWLVALCLVAAALLFVLPPLLRQDDQAQDVKHSELNITVYRSQLAELDADLTNNVISQDQYDRSRSELEKRLLQDSRLEAVGDKAFAPMVPARMTALFIAAIIPIFSIGFYKWRGMPEAIDPNVRASATAALSGDAEHSDSGKQIEQMIAQLDARLKTNPDDIEGWLMLARSYQVVERQEDAAKTLQSLRARLEPALKDNPSDVTGWLILATAYRMERNHVKAAEAYRMVMPMVEANPSMVEGKLADLLTEFADTLAMANNGTLEGEPIKVIDQALATEPNHIRALWLKGTYEYDKANYPAALTYWRRIRSQVPPNSEEAKTMDGNIAEIESRMRASGLAVPAAETSGASASSPTPSQTGAAKVAGSVQLSDALKASVAPSDTVFVYARAPSGSRMPLAIVRATAADLPLQFQLDESMAMAPGNSLANHAQVVVGARVSKSGNAMPQSGDLEGLSDVVNVGTVGITVVIDKTVN